MKKLIFLVVFFMIGVVRADAISDNIYVGEKIPNIYIRKISSTGEETVKQGGFIRRSSDNQAVYCVEPFILLEDNLNYNGYTDNYHNLLNIREDVWDLISLIAYYGYQYQNHQEDYWYYITQIMIWRVVDPNAQFYFTDTLGGENNPNLFASEIAEIESLVASHYLTPEFTNIEVLKNDTKRFSDKNNVLNNYEIINNSNILIDGNDLVVYGDNIKTETITLKKVNNNYNNVPIVYIADSSQNVLYRGNVADVECDVNMNITGRKIKINKIDALTQEPINIVGIKFAIFDAVTNELVLEGVTNDFGVFESDYVLGKGTYKIVEVQDQVINGYYITDKEYFFEIKDDNKEIVINVANNPVLGSIKVIKLNETGETLKNVTFALYDEYGQLVDIIKTNDFGEAVFADLRFGKYKLKEVATIDGYVLEDKWYDIELELENNHIESIIIEVVNYKPKGNLEIIKVNNDNNYLEGAEFVLYDENMQQVSTAITDKSGKITIANLNLGKYYLKETKAPSGYEILDKIIELELKQQGEKITVTITNDTIEVDIPDTYIGFEIAEFIVKRKKYF